MTINNANVEQINVALLDIDKRIKALNTDSETLKSLQNSVKTIKSSLNEKQAGLVSGATYDINISGNASTATSATSATTAGSATVADTALRADEAGHAESADTISAGGTSGQVLTSNGSSVAPSWQDPKLKTATLYNGSYNTANGSITLSDSIEKYSAIVVMVAMYGTEQIVPVFVPKAAYYWMGTSNYANEFIANGTVDVTTRRLSFGFLASTPTTLYIGENAGTANHLPAIKYVVGIK